MRSITIEIHGTVQQLYKSGIKLWRYATRNICEKETDSWVVEQLARQGFSESSDEVKLFKQSVLDGDSDSSLQQYFPG